MNRKQKQVQRHEKQIKHHKTLAERKQLKQLSRERRSEAHSKSRSRRAAEADGEPEGEPFEKMKSHRGRVRSGREVRETLDQVMSRSRGELDALVLSVHRGRLDLLIGERRESVPVPASMSDDARGRFAVGDHVTLARSEDDALRVRTVEPRRSEIARSDPHDPRRKRVLAANIDSAVVVCSARSPAFRPGLIDRFLIVLRQGGVKPVICVNKVDLLVDDGEREAVQERLEIYRSSAQVLVTSTETGTGLAQLQQAIAGQTVVFVGQSGVGKSSLLNALRPGSASTGDVRSGDGKGRHTTTGSTLHELDQGTRVIDTPGIRSFGLWQTGKHELAAEFAEFEPYADGCRFRDCLHVVEPDCAVRAAAESGQIERLRYDAYLRILESLD